MSKKKRTYPLRLIKQNYTYSLDQIADMYGIDLATVRRWIRFEGLERLPKTRPYLVHSTALRKFLEKRQKSRKQKCRDQEIYCLKCRCPRIPRPGSGNVRPQPNECIRFLAACATCGCKINKVIKSAEWSENHPLAAYLHDATNQHNRSQPLHPECHIQQREESCLNVTL